MNEYSIGQFGYFEYIVNRKIGNENQEAPIKMYGEIIEVNEHKIKIVDCYGIQYKPLKVNIKVFKILPKPE
jgi:hypothetical protein